MGASSRLGSARSAYGERSWANANDSFAAADEATSLEAQDLERLAISAYMVGLDEEFVGGLERAHGLHLNAGETLPAARCAFWTGINLMTQGEVDRAGGWFGRARRLVESADEDCVEDGYLILPRVLQHEAEGEWGAAADAAAEAASIGERFGDPDLLALAMHEQGFATIKRGQAREGLELLDEAMVAVSAGELSPLVTGLVYCSAIAYCQQLHQLRRAQQWTMALTRWCEEQPEMVAYSGQCLVHQAEIMQLRGAWSDALEQARLAGRRFAQGARQTGADEREGAAHYREAEIQRLRGDLDAAEAEYRLASRSGYEPQPGLALLRLAQSDATAAGASIRRALDETENPLRRAKLLPAQIEVMLAAGDTAAAAGACQELERVADGQCSDALLAVAAQARGATQLAAGNAREALVALRPAATTWQDLEAPYERARVRELIGLACRALGDHDTAEMELEGAGEAFEQLGAKVDLARIHSLALRDSGEEAAGLTPRELEVLRSICVGNTNKAIAAELVVSDRTVDRHVSNIFAKLGVSSRAAATAYAYEHDLL